jgi:hypothetical protein
MERVVPLQLNAEESKLFNESAQHVKDLVAVVRNLAPELG